MAIRELKRRAAEGKLSADQAKVVAQLALSEHRRDLPWGELLAWADTLVALEPVLTASQKTAALRQLVPLELEVPDQIRQGRPLTVDIAYGLRGISGSASVPSLRVQCILLDGEPYEHHDSRSHQYVLYGGRWPIVTETLDPIDLEPGRRRVEYDLQVAYLGTGNVVLSADFEVVAADAPDPTGLLDAPSFVKVLEKALIVRCRRPLGVPRRSPHVAGSAPPKRRATIFFHLMAPVPRDLALDVMLDVAGEELRIGTLNLRKGDTVAWADFETELPESFDGDLIDFILRASAKPPSVSSDPADDWDGELRLDGISQTGKLGSRDREITRRVKQGMRG